MSGCASNQTIACRRIVCRPRSQGALYSVLCAYNRLGLTKTSRRTALQCVAQDCSNGHAAATFAPRELAERVEGLCGGTTSVTFAQALEVLMSKTGETWGLARLSC